MKRKRSIEQESDKRLRIFTLEENTEWLITPVHLSNTTDMKSLKMDGYKQKGKQSKRFSDEQSTKGSTKIKKGPML